MGDNYNVRAYQTHPQRTLHASKFRVMILLETPLPFSFPVPSSLLGGHYFVRGQVDDIRSRASHMIGSNLCGGVAVKDRKESAPSHSSAASQLPSWRAHSCCRRQREKDRGNCSPAREREGERTSRNSTARRLRSKNNEAGRSLMLCHRHLMASRKLPCR